ncbi:MAG: hypothetical protein RLZZ546_3179, partial [Bacteroidota bacterium]
MWMHITINNFVISLGALFLFAFNLPIMVQFKPIDGKMVMLSKINEARSKGCYCGRKWMDATEPLMWNDTLFKSALAYAKHLEKNKLFSHISADGKDIGKRLDEFNYPWQYVGENLGEGQDNFDEVMRDWLNSRTHCRMLMNPLMKEVAVANHKGYWVQ